MKRSSHSCVSQVRVVLACALLALLAASISSSTSAVSDTNSTAQAPAEIGAGVRTLMGWRGAIEETESGDVALESHALSAFVQKGQDPEAIRQRVLQQMQVQYDAAIAAAHAQNAAMFDSTYQDYPEVPRGVLEAISYLRTDFQREQPVVDADGQMPMRRTYGILGLTVDDSGYFRNNLNLVAQLSGNSVEQIKQDSQTQLMAFAHAYVSIKHDLGIKSSNPADHLPILDALGDVPDGDSGDNAYARERYLYEILYVLNQSNYQTMFNCPRYEINLEQVFGSASYQLLSSPYVAMGSQTAEVTPTATCRMPNGLGVEHVQQTTSPVLWKPRSEALSYNVRYKKVSDANWQTFNVVPPTPQPNPVTSQLSSLTPATKYEFQVQSVCSAASVQPPVVSPFSSSFTFFTFNAGPICLEQGVNGCNYPNMQWDGNGAHPTRLLEVDLDGNGIKEEITDLRACNWISSIVIHTVEGEDSPNKPNSRYVNTIAGWKTPASGLDQGAGHYLVSKVDGQIYKAFDERLVVVHTFKNHSYSVGIEHTGTAAVGGFSPAMYDQSAKLVKAIACRYGIDTRLMYAGPATGYLGAKYELPFFQVTPLINLPEPENHRTYVPILGHGHAPKHGSHSDPGTHWNWFGYYELVNAEVVSLPFPIPTSETTLTECTDKLADDGGPSGNYSNSARRRWVIKPNCLRSNSKIKLSFSDFSTAPGDWMYVYDGEITYDQSGNPQGHLIGAWSNWASPNNNNQSGGHYYASQNNVDWGVHLTNPQSYKSPQKFFNTYAGATNGAITIELISDSFGHERGFTATWSVETPPTPPTTVSVQEECPLTCCAIPSNLDVIEVTSSTARIVWNPTGADHYNLRFRIAGEGDDQWRVRNSSDADRTLTGLERLTNYEVQVQSVCGTETSPDWSYSEFFTTPNCVDPPVGLRLVRAETDKLTVAWDSTGASDFKVEWKVSGRPDSEFDSQIVQGTSFVITKWRNEATLRSCTDYVVQVRSVCQTGNSQDIDASFRTSCPDDPPSSSCGLIRHCKGDPFRVLIEQSRNQFGERHFTARWATSDKRNPRVWRARYRECVHFPFDPPNEFSCLPFAHTVPPGRQKHKPRCTDNKHWDYVLEDFPIDVDGTILLDFEISCDGGTTWYEEDHILNDPNVAVSNITASSANISWQPVPNATGYVVTYGQAEAEEAITMSTQSTSVSLNGLVTNEEYDVEITSLLPEGNAKTPLAKFVTAAPGTCGVPQDLLAYDMTSNSAALSWGLAPGAFGYYVRYAVAGTSDWTDFYSIGNHAVLTGLSPATTYKFKVQSVCAGEIASGYSNKATLTTSGAPIAGYCAAAGSQSSYEWIQNVRLSNLNNTSGQDGGYGEYTNLSVNLAAGGTYQVSMTPGFTSETGPFPEYWRMWIDFNGNGSFSDPGELVLSPDAASTVIDGSFVVPGSATVGVTRMRVAMKFGGYPPECGDIQDGEVEDYAVNISAATNPPPPAPTSLTATAVSSSQINLGWVDNSNNETGFKIERSTDNVNFSLITTVAANTTSFQNTGLTPATIYYYRVKATNGSGDSAPSNTASATTPGTAPPAPTNLTATAVSSSQINLGWIDNSNNETGFKIERSTDNVNFSLIVTVAANATSYQNTGLTPVTSYYYRVKATNGTGDSAPSNTASATTLGTAPPAPTNLSATAVSSSQINLGWADNSNNETSFKIERSTDNVNFSLIATVAANATSYQNTGLTPATTYYYRVKATNGSGDSAPSNTASATTVSCSYGISPTGNTVPPAGVTGASVAVTANCSWTAVSSASWIVITAGSSGSGNGTVTYNILTNPGPSARSGSMTIGGQSFVVFQDACSYWLQPTSEMVSYTSTQSSVQVSAPGGCAWTAVSNASWITINSGSSGSGTGTVLYTIATNTSTTWPVNRTGTMTIAGQTFSVTQAGQPSCPNSSGLSCDSLGFQSCTKKCFVSSGGAATVYVWLSRTDCDWAPRVNVPWIHITSVTDNGTNPRKVNYSVDANSSAPSRIGVITINGLTHTVTQGGTSSAASGRVTTASGQGLAGVTITFSALTPYSGPATVVTDANGYWSQSGFISCKGNWASASKSGYTFTPNRGFFNLGAANVDFLATQTQTLNDGDYQNIGGVPATILATMTRPEPKVQPRVASSNNHRSQSASELPPTPTDPTGFAILGCVAVVFLLRLYRLRRSAHGHDS